MLLRSWLQVQDDIFVVRERVWSTRRVGILVRRPANEACAGIFAPTCSTQHRNIWYLLYHDFLQPLNRLLLFVGIACRGELFQQLVGLLVLPETIVATI